MKEKKVSTLRGPQLADLQGALCVPTYNLTLASRIKKHTRIYFLVNGFLYLNMQWASRFKSAP